MATAEMQIGSVARTVSSGLAQKKKNQSIECLQTGSECTHHFLSSPNVCNAVFQGGSC